MFFAPITFVYEPIEHPDAPCPAVNRAAGSIPDDQSQYPRQFDRLQ